MLTIVFFGTIYGLGDRTVYTYIYCNCILNNYCRHNKISLGDIYRTWPYDNVKFAGSSLPIRWLGYGGWNRDRHIGLWWISNDSDDWYLIHLNSEQLLYQKSAQMEFPLNYSKKFHVFIVDSNFLWPLYNLNATISDIIWGNIRISGAENETKRDIPDIPWLTANFQVILIWRFGLVVWKSGKSELCAK